MKGLIKYLVSRVNSEGLPNSRIHLADDSKTLCGLEMDERMYIRVNNDIDISNSNCNKCKESLTLD